MLKAGRERPILVTGAAGNLAGFTSRHLLDRGLPLRLMVHHARPAPDLPAHPRAELCRADLGDPETLLPACQNVRAVIHFAGRLFAPNPKGFLWLTNVVYVQNLVHACRAAGVERIVLVSFPHVEGPTTPEAPATGRLDQHPPSVHARTRLQAERVILEAAERGGPRPVILRTGTVYGTGVKMFEAARWLMARRLMAVWPRPTWFHFIHIDDFVRGAEAALRRPGLEGIYPLGDEAPMTLQAFLDRLADHWGYARPWRLPDPAFYLAGWMMEGLTALARIPSPLTGDFIRIGHVPHTMDTRRMKDELLPRLDYPTVEDGLASL